LAGEDVDVEHLQKAVDNKAQEKAEDGGGEEVEGF